MTALYIHIPFCRKKCRYCDFVSYAGKEALIEEYVGALIKEIQSSPLSFASQNSFPSPSTIYFGGGTPTLFEPRHFDKIIKTLISHFVLKHFSAKHSSLVIRHSEITIEANPGTADKAKLKALRQLGINRLSIGAQSFNDKHLQTLGRIHNSKEIFRIYDDARAVGFENINLDLIFALPNQTLEEWKNDLETAIDLGPEHLSCYCLEGKMAQLGEDQELAMYEYTIETLTAAGFKHYEISNFARPGFECQHNINYWKNGNYLGIGAGAHSHVNGRRWANPDSVETYIGCGGVGRNVNRQTSDDSLNATNQRETLFMGLRMLEGLDIGKFKGFEKEAAELMGEGLLMQENGNYKLTRKGLYLGNLVFEKFI